VLQADGRYSVYLKDLFTFPSDLFAGEIDERRVVGQVEAPERQHARSFGAGEID
jgi:hypothetical protein